jgi:WD40 repeat protein
MTDLDDRISTLLQERAREHVTDPRMPRTVATRSRRRRALVGTGAGLAAVAAIVVGAAALRGLAFEDRTGGDPTVTPTPDPAAAWPETFVGLRGGEIVLVDVPSGDVVRVLVDNETLGGPSEEVGIADLEVSPDGSTAYFVPSGKPGRIMSVSTAGGAPTIVAQGRKPTISPDGRYLAHVTCGGDLGFCVEGISVLDLGTGRERHWAVGFSDQWAGQLAWLPDSRSLAFSMFYAGDSNPTLHVLDTADDAEIELKDLAEVGPNRAGAGWTVVGYHTPSNGLVVRHYCCSTYATDEVEESSVISVTTDGEIVTTLLPSADWIDIELDATGRHFLLLEPGGIVYRLDDAGERVPIADGFEDVDW